MGIEEKVGKEIDELQRPGKNFFDVADAYKRMNDIGAGTYFFEQFTLAFNDKTKAATGTITLCMLALSAKQIKKTEVTI